MLYSMFKKAILATSPCATSRSAGFPEKHRKMCYNMDGRGGVGNILCYGSYVETSILSIVGLGVCSSG